MPLPYQPENYDIPVQTPLTDFDALRTIAVSRIYLDNCDHLTAYLGGHGTEAGASGVELRRYRLKKSGNRLARRSV